jgi:hypothetical protein
MNTVVPVMIVVVLGGLAGAALHRVRTHLLVVTVLATVLAAVVWVAGVYLLLWLTAPNELGPPMVRPILMTLAAAFPGALLGVWGMRRMIRSARFRPS